MKTIITACIGLLLASAAYGRAADSSKIADSLLFFSADILAYMNNLEYFNTYRQGKLLLGGYGKLRFTYRPDRAFDFSLGVYMRKSFGDEKFFSDVRPIFRGHVNLNAFSLVIGELFSDDRHRLPDAMLREQASYEPGIEEGIQILIRKPRFSFDLWAVYDSLNTREHREHLVFGNHTGIRLGAFDILGMALAGHYGGQLFAPENDPVRENITGGAGFRYTLKRDKKVSRLVIEQIFIGSRTTTDRKAVPYHNGWGSVSRFEITIFGFETSALFFRGADYVTWQGNPLYHADAPYYYLQVSRPVRFPFNATLDWGVRMDFVGIPPSEYFNKVENQIWVTLSCGFDRRIF